jgi:hypothetical protein
MRHVRQHEVRLKDTTKAPAASTVQLGSVGSEAAQASSCSRVQPHASPSHVGGSLQSTQHVDPMRVGTLPGAQSGSDAVASRQARSCSVVHGSGRPRPGRQLGQLVTGSISGGSLLPQSCRFSSVERGHTGSGGLTEGRHESQQTGSGRNTDVSLESHARGVVLAQRRSASGEQSETLQLRQHVWLLNCGVTPGGQTGSSAASQRRRSSAASVALLLHVTGTRHVGQHVLVSN